MITEEKRIGNYLIEVEQDDNTESPREWDNLGTMICFHSRYNLGDKHNFSSDEGREFLKSKDTDDDGYITSEEFENSKASFDDWLKANPPTN
jgi:hypothetical protein